jgi:hypothetical protein
MVGSKEAHYWRPIKPVDRGPLFPLHWASRAFDGMSQITTTVGATFVPPATEEERLAVTLDFARDLSRIFGISIESILTGSWRTDAQIWL